jgi:hypothetical protein
MAGFLNDIAEDVAKAENPNHVPDGVYPAFIYESGVKEIKGVQRWVINYKIAPNNGPASGKTVGEMFTLKPTGPNRDMQLSFLKARLVSLGVPESRFGEFEPGEIQGWAVTIKVATSNEYTNVKKMELRDENIAPNVSAQSAGQPTPNGVVL